MGYYRLPMKPILLAECITPQKERNLFLLNQEEELLMAAMNPSEPYKIGGRSSMVY